VSPGDRKRALREFGRNQRRSRSAASGPTQGLADAALGLAQVQRASSVAAYVGVGDEPDTRELLERLRARGVTVLLPVVLPGLDLDWARYGGPDDLAPGPRGLLEPVGERLGREAIGTVDVVLAPALAVDSAGRRLGQGGGCYDRALARVPDATPVFAVVFAEEVVPGPLPEEPHDRRVDGVVTAP
jgi:5-formyltetrahydrofolate cyclo-ligase